MYTGVYVLVRNSPSTTSAKESARGCVREYTCRLRFYLQSFVPPVRYSAFAGVPRLVVRALRAKELVVTYLVSFAHLLRARAFRNVKVRLGLDKRF